MLRSHKMIVYVYKGTSLIFDKVLAVVHHFQTRIKLLGNGVKFDKFRTRGVPFVLVSFGGFCVIGRNFEMNNGSRGNPIGRPQRCHIFVGPLGELKLGNNVGISSTAIVCYKEICIGDNVKIGGGCCIYDTDFHALSAAARLDRITDKLEAKSKSVEICDNAFIGAHTTILKGVRIGENSVVGACSVVTKSVPDNEIWAGNPAIFIRKL